MSDKESFRELVRGGIPEDLPPKREIDSDVDHAPPRPMNLDRGSFSLAIENALRYFPKSWHEELAEDFSDELRKYGHVYMHRFRPNYPMHARPISEYPAETPSAAAIMLMIQNNLDPAVAQYPHELVTYGGNGSVFQNWAQYLISMRLLSMMSEDQTLVMYSGHPMGLFPSNKDSPRVIITNGMMIPNHSTQEDYEYHNAIGVTQYGQMTAGSYMYIGPQGIVHGTTITLLNAARLHLGLDHDRGLEGVLFVTSGLGGMSGAQAKAAVITGAVGIIAETNRHAVEKRHSQGWLSEMSDDLEWVTTRAKDAIANKEAISIGYIGNIVDLLEHLEESNVVPDLCSDQTSLHNPWLGGYIPRNISHSEASEMLSDDPKKFRKMVKSTLVDHGGVINRLSEKGMKFWDYGNAFLLEASRAGADVGEDGSFRYPSYVENIMGPMCFDFGFGPFRWVCSSGSREDLKITDEIAKEVLLEQSSDAPDEILSQILDNLRWITNADDYGMVVGSQARILYADGDGRKRIAAKFNEAVASGKLSAPIILGRDHHDVSGTDSPYRETANIRDGSRFTADMAVQNFIGDACRGATWVSLHNGGGVGWGEVMNGGFGLVLDGSVDASLRAESMLSWDVDNGIARRAWARNPGAMWAINRAKKKDPRLVITEPSLVDEELLDKIGGYSP
ncbi:MAG: urocanate hydratase [Candidatus Thalassarchaeaceae archaeon]